VLCQVHGRPQLHLPQAQDARAKGIITISTTSQHAYQCDVECIEQAEALAESLAILTGLGDCDQDIPDPKRHARSFEPAEETKLVFLDPGTSEGKALRISSSLDPK